MKKKILSGIFALALLATAGYGVNQSMKSNVDLSDLALANVEALAQNENDGWPCKDCSTCTGEYYVCESQYDNWWDDVMKNCRGLDVILHLIPEC